MVGYKMVTVDKGKYYSGSLPPGLRQLYRLNKVTKRRQGWGALMLYKSLGDMPFVLGDMLDQTKVLRCEYEPLSDESAYIPNTRLRGYDKWVYDMIEFGVSVSLNKELLMVHRCSGFIYADEITPLEVIKGWYRRQVSRL